MLKTVDVIAAKLLRLPGLLYDHSWEIADRSFKLFGWIAILAALWAVQEHEQNSELRWMLRALTAIWIFAATKSAIEILRGLHDELMDLAEMSRWGWWLMWAVSTLICGGAAAWLLPRLPLMLGEIVQAILSVRAK